MKKTQQRLWVLEVLQYSVKPLNISEISLLLKTSGNMICLSTVYRIIELFVRKGLVIKTNIMNYKAAVYELNRSQNKQYAVCINCQKVIPITGNPIEIAIPSLTESNFRILSHSLEIYGFCIDCQTEK